MTDAFLDAVFAEHERVVPEIEEMRKNLFELRKRIMLNCRERDLLKLLLKFHGVESESNGNG